MRIPNAHNVQTRRSMALKLTIFTATEISTASHWAAVATGIPANALRPGSHNCVEFAIARGARLRSHTDNGLNPKNAHIRIPLPANDNIRMSYLLPRR
ncbi:MAG: hypothetical protein HKN30_11815 [Sulfitobacter sp.]|nr:hypothetical protein [Sulfitobacter sp.]